jgi:hypothetical protein
VSKTVGLELTDRAVKEGKTYYDYPEQSDTRTEHTKNKYKQPKGQFVRIARRSWMTVWTSFTAYATFRTQHTAASKKGHESHDGQAFANASTIEYRPLGTS